MCSCGIVYSIKVNLCAESLRDFMDLLFSWKHMPYVVVYDFVRGLVTHGNLRDPENVPFSLHEGGLLQPTDENKRLAKEKRFWSIFHGFRERKWNHPVTGSDEHYALYDRHKHKMTETSYAEFIWCQNLRVILTAR